MNLELKTNEDADAELIDQTDGRIVATVSGYDPGAVAAIIQAVNLHDDLVTFAKVLREYMRLNRKEINEDLLEHVTTVLEKAGIK